MKPFLALSAAAAAVIFLSGCGGPPADGGKFETATELKNAFVKAGGKCDEWKPHNKTAIAATSGSCEHYALSVFTDLENKDLMVEMFKTGGVGAVAGKNWVVSGVDDAAAHKLLGGELVSAK